MSEAEVLAFWQQADKNNDGNVTVQELKAAVRQMSQCSDQDIAKMFCDIDGDGDGKITWDEFSSEMLKKPKRSETLKKLFKDYDKSGDGFLSRDELSQLIKASGQYKNPGAVIKQVLESCDANNDGQISLDEFMKACG